MSPSQFGEQSWLLFQTSGHHRGHVPYLQVNTRHNQFDVKDTRQLAPIKAFLLARWRQISSMADRMQVHIWIWRSYQHIAFNFKSNKLHFPLKQHSLRLEMFLFFFLYLDPNVTITGYICLIFQSSYWVKMFKKSCVSSLRFWTKN